MQQPVPLNVLTREEQEQWDALVAELIDSHERGMVSWVDSALAKIWDFVQSLGTRLSEEKHEEVRAVVNDGIRTCWNDAYIANADWRTHLKHVMQTRRLPEPHENKH